MSDTNHFVNPTFNSTIHSCALQDPVNKNLLHQDHLGCKVCSEYRQNESDSKSNPEVKAVSSTVNETRNYEKDGGQEEDVDVQTEIEAIESVHARGYGPEHVPHRLHEPRKFTNNNVTR